MFPLNMTLSLDLVKILEIVDSEDFQYKNDKQPVKTTSLRPNSLLQWLHAFLSLRNIHRYLPHSFRILALQHTETSLTAVGEPAAGFWSSKTLVMKQARLLSA